MQMAHLITLRKLAKLLTAPKVTFDFFDSPLLEPAPSRISGRLDDRSGKFESANGPDLKGVAAPDGAASPFLLKGAAGDKEFDCR